jgi:deazaflavin-dependent oxidoreductase (nitroreductase family)
MSSHFSRIEGGYTMRILLMRLIPKIHRAVFRLTRGRTGGRMGSMSIMLLTTTGRRTGQPRATPVAYFMDGDRYVLAGSNGGLDTDPAWVLNIRALPTATVQVRDRTFTVEAQLATPDERDRLWARLVEIAPGYQNYAKRTSRIIPMITMTISYAAT